tara:strand:+ start:9 stop:773 length:765 start_codon:yes stop_codon:yes gene_type:complete
MEFAPRNEKSSKLYYRGMKEGYGFSGLNDEIIVRNFSSVSDSLKVAFGFSNRINKCCIHELQIDKGIPIINMITNTKFKKEKETLLPRDLVFKLVGFKDIDIGGKKWSIRKIKVSLMNPNQYKIKTGCDNYPTASISPIEEDFFGPSPVPLVKTKTKTKTVEILDGQSAPILQQIPTNVEANLEPAQPIKLKRCPNGSTRDKQTKLCIDKDGNVVNTNNQQPQPQQPVVQNAKTKKRCPNGQRRNKQTGLCEPK